MYDEITYFKTCDFIISYQVDDAYWMDNDIFDSRQTWFNPGWGITTGYGSHDYGQTSMGFYYENRWWSGGIGEVIVYGSYLSADDRINVETYLKQKWLKANDGTVIVVR